MTTGNCSKCSNLKINGNLRNWGKYGNNSNQSGHKCQCTPFITQTNCTFLIQTHIKWTSPSCFGTSVPSSGRTHDQVLKTDCQTSAVTTAQISMRCIGTWILQNTGHYIFAVAIKKKVKQSRYRPGVAQRVPGS
jgi:hypothetical protein